MDKTILFLINGLGTEQKDSYNIYNADILPNFDGLVNDGIFTKLPILSKNYQDGCKEFSIGTLEIIEKWYIDSIIEEQKDERFLNMKKYMNMKQGSIHMFVELDSLKTIEQLDKFVKALELNSNRNVLVHFVLPQEDMSGYDILQNCSSKILYGRELNLKIGTIIGKNFLKINKLENMLTYNRLLFKGMGEKWPDLDRKLSSLIDRKVLPQDANPFRLTNEFSITADDIFFFYNFKKDNYDTIINYIKTSYVPINNDIELNKITFISLFPLNTKLNIGYTFNYARTNDCLNHLLEEYDVSLTYITHKETANYLNYVNNGFSNSPSSKIKYLVTNGNVYDEKSILNIIQNSSPLVILDYRIENNENVENLKKQLTAIDKVLGAIKANIGNNHLIVSSLYGINETMPISSNDKKIVRINFSKNVPVIFYDMDHNKRDYVLSGEKTKDLIFTAIQLVKKDNKIPTMLRKKSGIMKFLSQARK